MSATPLCVHLSQLEKGSVQLSGELTPEQLDLPMEDEVVHPHKPLSYNLHVELAGGSVLVQGSLHMVLNVDCVRCLRRFEQAIDLPEWTCQMPVEGDEESGPLGDLVDLTRPIREDIVLAFPQHPLCDSECNGLPGQVKQVGEKLSNDAPGQKSGASVWAQLDKLKLN